MAENQNGAQTLGKKHPRVVNKIGEFLPYSGREAFKRLRTNVLLSLEDEEEKCRVIGVTSAQVSEGKSTISINLAYSLAELGKRVLLIDGDMRRPTVHEKVGVRVSPGLSDVLTGGENLGNAVVRYTSSTGSTYFEMLTSGEIPDNPAELLNSSRFKKLISAIAGAVDFVIIDLPPVNAVVDAVTVSQCTDGLIVVVRENNCPRAVMNDCMEQLNYAKANILGFVMNGCAEGAAKHRQYYHNYYYNHYGK